jgi:hypothetical protein
VPPIGISAAHGLDGLPVERLVDPRAQPSDVDLDDVRVAFEVVFPNAIEDFLLRDHVASPPHEELEHIELTGGE